METTNLVDKNKIFSPKYLITTVLVVIVVMFVLSKVLKNSIVLKDTSGAVMGTGEIDLKLGLKKKS
jgi:hypothetical protein